MIEEDVINVHDLLIGAKGIALDLDGKTITLKLYYLNQEENKEEYLVTYTYKEKVYKLTADPSSKTYYVGDEISHTLYDGSIVKVYTDNVDITSYAKINNIKITDKYGNTVTNITSASPNTYKVTYSVSHGTYSGTCSNTIYIQEKPTPTPSPTPTPTTSTEPEQETTE